MAKKPKGPDFWPDEGQLQELQQNLGYYFADTQHLYDALDISNQGAQLETAEGRRNHARSQKIFLGKELLRTTLGINVYYSEVESHVEELTRGRELWNQQGAVVVAAQKLGLDEILMRRDSQKTDAASNNALVDAYAAVLRAAYDDMHEQGASDDVKVKKIRQIVGRQMPIMEALPLGEAGSAVAAGAEPSQNNIIDRLQVSKEFKDRGLAFIWEETKKHNETSYSQKLRLVQMKKDEETGQATDEVEKDIMEVSGRGADAMAASAVASKKMVNEMMGTHYFSEILRTIGTARESRESGV